jgi:hypothetical protein
MKTGVSKLDTWVLNKIKTEYKDDILLLIGHNSYRLEKDAELAKFSFFFPATDRGNELARTFIIDGIGYDLFPMSWERIERMTELDEDNASCVGDSEILYYRKEEDRKRFLELQIRLQDHMKDPQFLLKKSLEKVGIAMELYQTMMFEDSLYKVRKAAGYILNYLITAVTYSNGKYFSKIYVDHLPELSAMKNIPVDFTGLYEAVVKVKTNEEIKTLCHQIIYNTRQYLGSLKGKPEKRREKQDYRELAGWYEELSYAWREIYHWCDRKDPVKAFIRGCFLQSELDIVGEEFELGEMDLLGSFDAGDMTKFRSQAETLAKKVISATEGHNVKIDKYDSIDEFLKKNT